MTPNETDDQVDAQNKASTATTPLEEISSNPSKDIVGGSIPSNVLDRPIESLEDDLIGTKDLQDGLIEYIKRADKPFTIALQGEWGLGKTSFLNLLKTQLCDKNNSLYYSVWIDACDFTLLQSPTSAVINMLQSMVYQIGNLNPTIAADQQGKECIKKIVLFIKNVGKPLATKIIATGIEAATDGAISADITKPAISGALSNQNKQSNSKDNTLSVVKKLRGDIINLIKYILDPNNKENYYTFTENHTKLNISSTITQYNQEQDSKDPVAKDQEKQGIVFFIDNLDRIDPTLAVEILEITKNIFDFEKCAFIISIDNNIIIRGLQSKLGPLTKENQHIFQGYIDKFVQQSISIQFQGTTVSELLFTSLLKIGFFTKDELCTHLSNEPDKILEIELIKFSWTSIKLNPRFIKRFANTLSLILFIKKAQNKNMSEKHIEVDPIDHISKALMYVIIGTKLSNPELYQVITDAQICTIYGNNDSSSQNPTDSNLENIKTHMDRINKNNTKIKDLSVRLMDILHFIEILSNNKTSFNKKLGEIIELTTYLNITPLFPN